MGGLHRNHFQKAMQRDSSCGDGKYVNFSKMRLKDFKNGPIAAGRVLNRPSPMNQQILLIEDDNCVRELLSQTLVKAGYSVIPAADGEEGLDLFRTNHPDLVITDLIMPQKEGLQMILELRRDNPNTKVIAMSGGGRYSNTDYLKLAKKFGARATLTKPFLREEILNVVKDVLGEEYGNGENKAPAERAEAPKGR
jgi:DNA-binding response OmpR family regulator